MSKIPDSLLAIDIETASPHNEPGRDDFQNTEFFELIAVGLGYQPEPAADIETEVVFRNGGWDSEATCELLQRASTWCGERDGEAILTHNGEQFDEIHLKSWAQDLSEQGEWSEGSEEFEELFSRHIDLNPIAVHRYQDRLQSWRDFVKLEEACELEGLAAQKTYYEDYELGALSEHDLLDPAHVTNTHVGGVLGEAYVEHHKQNSTGTKQFQELERLLQHYTEADIEPLFQLARRFDNT
jgi:hypothetical protein